MDEGGEEEEEEEEEVHVPGPDGEVHVHILGSSTRQYCTYTTYEPNGLGLPGLLDPHCLPPTVPRMSRRTPPCACSTAERQSEDVESQRLVAVLSTYNISSVPVYTLPG